MNKKLNLSVQYADTSFDRQDLPSRQQIFVWARAALVGGGNITIRLVKTSEMQELNNSYRQANYPTNVLSFAYQEQPIIIGDIAICPQVVKDEANASKISFFDHFAHMVVHGILHLQGYDHLIDHEALIMEQLETNILAQLAINDPYHHVR